MMSENFGLCREFSLQQKALHELAKICWDEYVIRIDGEYISVPHKTTELNTHLDNTLNKLPQILNTLPKSFSANLPKRLMDKVNTAVIRLHQCYIDALIWEDKCNSALPFTILNPKTAGNYEASCFVDPTGHFNDWAWAKLFVSDGDQDIYCRFQLACFYCFEKEIANIWHIMKTNGKLPCKGKLSRIKSKYGDLVGLWAYQLENKMDELVEKYSYYADGFYVCGLREAIHKGHEYGARYFWSRCTDVEKAKFLNELEYYSYYDLHCAAENRYTGIVYFIYSLLSLEHKNNLIQRTNQLYGTRPSIWSCLLDSLLYEKILNDIVTFPYTVPSKFYAVILKELACKTKESRNPIHARIFKILWNHLLPEQRKEVFEWGCHVSFLTKIKALDLLEFIIQSLSNREKEQMILNNWGGAGWTAIEQFSKDDDYDALLRYLLIFFIDRDPGTRQLSVRVDASNFLNHSIKEMFTRWTKYEIPESEIEEVSNIIESIEGGLSVLYQLLQQVEKVNFDRKKDYKVHSFMCQ